jgi:hypothetical protein
MALAADCTVCRDGIDAHMGRVQCRKSPGLFPLVWLLVRIQLVLEPNCVPGSWNPCAEVNSDAPLGKGRGRRLVDGYGLWVATSY